ncbi:MAG: hypothetical protein K6G09_07160 [Treponema sp.]|nr:hypothetical protein [Treponema sp.]
MVELSAFRGEMKEFKKTVEKRIDSLDMRQLQCQSNPMTCANARKLEEHIKNEGKKSGKILALIACIISCFNVAVTIITLVVKSL